MRVIARIPDVSAPGTGGAVPSGTGRRASRPRARDGVLTGIVEGGFSWPLAALAVTAILAWVLASWNDHSRLRRQRGEFRLAREASTVSGAPDPAAFGAGAVVR